jgi:hypothetical protein
MSELFFVNDQVQEWKIFREVHSLFASAIPWQIPDTKMPAEEICIASFRVFLPQDMSSILRLCPKRGLKEKQFDFVLHPLSLLLQSLDRLVLDTVLNRAKGDDILVETDGSIGRAKTHLLTRQKNMETISVERETDITNWLTSTFDMSGNPDPIDGAADHLSHLKHAGVDSSQDRVPVQFAKLKALGDIMNSQSHQHDRHNRFFVFLQLTNDMATYEDIQQKLKVLTESMQRFQRKTNLMHSGHSSHNRLPNTQWDNLTIGKLSSALYASFSRMLRPGGGCPGHNAFIRLNGFDLEKEPTFFDVFLSICPSSLNWRAGRCTSIDR